MKWSSLFLGTSVLALGLAVTGVASAAPITGHVGFSGSAVYDTRPDGGPCPVGGCQLATVDFYDIDGVTPDATAGDGVIVRIAAADGYFSALNVLSTAVIKDVTNDPADAPPSMFIPAGVSFFPVGIANFLSNFSDPDYPGLHFDITELVLQPGSTCVGDEGAGDTCVEGPFRLSETATGFSIAFDVLGFFRRGIDEGYYVGKFDITIATMTFAELFSRLNDGLDIGCGATRDLSCNVQANFDPTAVPEPATMLTFGVGSAILAAARRRKAAKANKA